MSESASLGNEDCRETVCERGREGGREGGEGGRGGREGKEGGRGRREGGEGEREREREVARSFIFFQSCATPILLVFGD